MKLAELVEFKLGFKGDFNLKFNCSFLVDFPREIRGPSIQLVVD